MCVCICACYCVCVYECMRVHIYIYIYILQVLSIKYITLCIIHAYRYRLCGIDVCL